MSGGGGGRSWDVSVFDRIHAREADPWAVETSDYERAKYDATLAALPAGRFARGLEVGCSIGAQTVRLAERCDRLLALDIAAEPVRRTRERCAGLGHVEVRQAQVPVDWPGGVFDLIVLSEVLYFLDAADIASVGRLVLGGMARGGAVLVVNWTGETDTPVTGDEASDLLIGATRGVLTQALARREEGYRLDLLRR